MTVYFIGGDFDRVKIGFTDHPTAEGRLSDLQAGSPVGLRILAQCPGDRTDEGSLHREFDEHRTHREWFKVEGRVAALIGYVRQFGTLAGWREAFENPGLFAAWAETGKPVGEFSAALRMGPPDLAFELTTPSVPAEQWTVSLASLEMHWSWGHDIGSDSAFVRHQITEAPSRSRNELNWIRRRTGRSPWPEKQGLQVSGWFIVDASGDANKEMAFWIQAACRDLVGRDSLKESRLARRVPQIAEILAVCAEVYETEWHRLITQALPTAFSLPERARLTPPEFVRAVSAHRAATWAEWQLVVDWREGYHWPIEWGKKGRAA